MNPKFFLLSMTLIAAGQALPANAQNSRWDFAPNVYGAESHQQMRKHPTYVPHSATPGAMPHSSAFLGISPDMLKPKPAPMAVPSVAATISVPHVQAAPFNHDFGAPISEQHANPAPMTAMNAPAARGMAPQFHSSHDGHAHLVTPIHSKSMVAHAAPLPTIQGYGPNMGYNPGGGGVPGTGGTSSHADTNVNGHIVGMGRH